MGYLVKLIVGVALFAGGIYLFNEKLIALLETGTCASGNTPYEIARPCPQGTGTDALLLTAGLFASLAGCVVFAFRGQRPWGRARNVITGAFGWMAIAWGAFFTATGATALIAAQSSETIGPDGELGGTIVGITFLVMGAPVLLAAGFGVARRLLRDEERSASIGTSTGRLGSGG